MKNYTFLFILFLIGFSHSFAQENPFDLKKSHYDVSFDALGFSIGKGISLAVDKVLNKSESIGFNVDYYSQDLALGFNYKHFFSKRYAQGFYMQVGLTNHLQKEFIYYPNNISSSWNYSLNFNFMMGYKLFSRKNFMLDFYSGFSQNIIGIYNLPRNNRHDFRYGIRIGKRF